MIETLISNISDKSIQNFIRSKNSSFREYKEDLSYILQDKTLFQNLYKLGEISYDNSDELLVFYCAYKGELSSKSSKRTQFEIAKKVLKEDFKDGAIFVFYDDKGKFRFSFIRKNYGNQTEKLSNWKRFTYFIDKQQQTNRTFIDTIGSCSFDSLDNIQERFNIEPISKEFFNGYKAQYEKFCNYMQTNKDMLRNFASFLEDGTNKAVRDYVKKMLGRIIFLQFLQKKGWMGVPKDSKNWIGGDTNFLENLYKRCSKEQQENFLDDVLEPLFFKSLNYPRENDLYDTKTSIGIVRIPYLNGGLFEKDKLDEPDSKFPSSYFKDLFGFFNQYNFTIDENDPNDAEVSVDPEMLGHIFENLLEDNKDKGAFYTPKDIVHYMCQESLIEYLNTSLKIGSDIEKEHVYNLIKYHDLGHSFVTRISEIDRYLDDVKICDPAIGSGAFPMGLLHEIFRVKQTLWLYKNHNLNDFPASKVKQNIIQNSIYGVDIEKGAVDIARLRFWLSLVVDKEEPDTLPNLDYKIMCGDSLICRFDINTPINDVFLEYNKSNNKNFTLKEYKNLVENYTNAHEEKEAFRRIIEEIKSAFKSVLLKEDLTKRKKREAEVISYESVGMFGERKADRDKEGYSKAKKELAYFLQLEKETTDNKLYKNSFEWRFEFPSLLDEFGNFMGFDIVIGNPPYVSNKGVDDSLKNYFGFSDDLYNYFFIKGDRILRDKGILCYITSNTYLTLQSKLNIREQLLRNELLNITNLGHDVFKSAMVSTSIAIYKKNDVKAKTKLIDARGKTKLADAKFYELEQSIFELTPNKVIFIPNEFNLSVHKKYNTKLKWLLDEYWDKISSSTNISKFRDDINRYRNSLNDQDVTLLGLITDGGQGLATANNGFFVGVRNGTKEAERTKISRFIKIKEFNAKNRLNYTIENLSENEIRELFEYLKDKFGRDTFGQGYLYQIVQDEEIADINNLSVNEKIEGIQGTRTFVPYEKGDREGNRWYLVTPYYINWSRKNVAFLKSNSGKKGKGMPVVRNFDFYFKEGFCWSDIHTVMIKSRYKGISVHDVVGMSLFPILDKITAKYLVCIINSQFASEYSYEFLNNTSHFQINDARCLPIIVPSKEQLNDFEDIFDRAFNVQVLKFDNKITNEEAEEKLNLIQLELDKKVNTLYLN